MADVRVTPQRLLKAGIVPAYTGSLSTSDTYLVRNSGRTFLQFKKSGATDCVVTVDTPMQIEGLDVAQLAVTVVATTGDKMLGPFSPNVFNDGLGDLRITLSNITGLTIAAFEL